MEIRRGKIIDFFAITPNFNFSWTRFQKGTVCCIQLAWIRWYITIVINAKNTSKYDTRTKGKSL